MQITGSVLRRDDKLPLHDFYRQLRNASEHLLSVQFILELQRMKGPARFLHPSNVTSRNGFRTQIASYNHCPGAPTRNRRNHVRISVFLVNVKLHFAYLIDDIFRIPVDADVAVSRKE